MRDIVDARYDFVTRTLPTEKRKRRLDGEYQEYLTEGAVMIALALHLIAQVGARNVVLRPDGEHGKRYMFREVLTCHGFFLIEPRGRTVYGGLYARADGQTILIEPKPGLFDVSAEGMSGRISAETKGGILNTSHPGPTSRLRRGLYEAIGLLMSKPKEDGERQLAVVPDTNLTRQLGSKLAPRLAQAGIGLALIDRFGVVTEVV